MGHYLTTEGTLETADWRLELDFFAAARGGLPENRGELLRTVQSSTKSRNYVCVKYVAWLYPYR